MTDQDPKNVTPIFKNGVRVNRWKTHPFVKDAPDAQAQRDRATALDFQAERAKERAEDEAAEAAEAAKRTFFGKVFHAGVIFTLGVVPDAIDDALDWTRELFKRRKS